jgi:predicted acylesterase/phospholipase RssA
VFKEQVSKDELSGSTNNKTFVGVAISGGGSRAANFSLATLWQLEQAGLLPQETVISSVSGGSLTAAYYALHRNEDDWANQRNKIKEHFRSDIQGEWMKWWLYPRNILQYWFTPYDRSDIMKDVMDRFLRGYQEPFNIPLGLGGFDYRKRFSDIKPNGVDLPSDGQSCNTSVRKSSKLSRLLINATLLDGRSFVFTNEIFRDIGSSLNNYPIADAVMASSAFPGLFNTVTLEHYNDPFNKDGKRFSRQDALPFRSVMDERIEDIPENLPHDWLDNKKYKEKGEQTYLHLMDGGASDNLGVGALVKTIRAENHNKPPSEKYDHCVLYLIDSYQDPLDKKWSRQARSNAIFDGDRRRMADYFVDSDAMKAFDTLLTNNRANELKVLNYPEEKMGVQSYWETKEIEVTGKLSCQIWHISFQRLGNLAKASQNEKEKAKMRCVSRIANETVTAYRLDSPGIHDKETLQQNLFDAATILVSADKIASPETGARCKKGEECLIKDVLADQYEKWGIELIKSGNPNKDYRASDICENIDK